MQLRPLHVLAPMCALLASFAAAQTAGRIDTLRGCTNPGPADSLRGELVQPTVWVADENDFVAFEIESVPAGGGWALRADPTKPGWSGVGYFEWINQNQPTIPGFGLRTYRVFIKNAATYQIRIHNRHDNPLVNQGNDCWLRINGGEWFKAYSNDGSNVAVWNWDFKREIRNNGVETSLNRGINTIEISARSTGFILDRCHIFRAGFPFADLSLPISQQLRSRPVRGQNLVLEVGDPTNQTGLPAGTTQAVLFANLVASPNAPCGVLLPGFGPTGGPGEFLLALSPEPFTLTAGTEVWNGPANPARFTLPVPNVASIVGFEMFVQGGLVDLAQPRAVLTDGAKLTFGSF